MPRPTLPSNCGCCQRPFSGRVRRGSTQEICEACYDEAGYENAHSDGHHEAEADANCHVCQGTDPHASFRTRVASGNQGKVLRDTDGRLNGNGPVVPEGADRVKLLGFMRGRPAPKYSGLEASVIQRKTQTWDGHNGEWVQVMADGIAKCRWFWAEEVEPVAAAPTPRRRRNAGSAA